MGIGGAFGCCGFRQGCFRLVLVIRGFGRLELWCFGRISNLLNGWDRHLNMISKLVGLNTHMSICIFMSTYSLHTCVVQC